MRIKQVQGHLHRVKPESVLRGSLEHVEVDARILMSGKQEASIRAAWAPS